MTTSIRALTKGMIRALLIAAGLSTATQFVQASDELGKHFNCLPDKRFQSELKMIRLTSVMASEGDPRSYKGVFSTDRLELVFKGRGSTFIELIEPFTFNAQSKTKHSACKNFAFRFMDGLVFFDYRYGSGNPYPPQQILVFDQKLKLLKLSPALKKIFNGSIDVEFRSDCISVVGESRADFEYGCIRNRTYVVEKKTLFFSASGTKEYRVLCDTKIASGAVLELDEYRGTPPVNEKFISPGIVKRAELLCRDLQQKLKPQLI